MVSDFPFGLFRKYKQVEIEKSAKAVIYPALAGGQARPHSMVEAGTFAIQQKDNFDGLREYSAGDRLSDVAWKASARGQGLLVKQFDGDGKQQDVILHPEMVKSRNWEEKLSQLAVWAVDLNRQGRDYGLIIGKNKVNPDIGDKHLVKVLEILSQVEGKNLGK